MNYGEQVNTWQQEWEASSDLQLQFLRWTDYAFGGRLKAVWEASADIQRQYGGDFVAFKMATKKHASDFAQAARDKASRDQALRQADRGRPPGVVGSFIRRMMGKDSPEMERTPATRSVSQGGEGGGPSSTASDFLPELLPLTPPLEVGQAAKRRRNASPAAFDLGRRILTVDEPDL